MSNRLGFNIAVFVSGGGTNLQSLIDAQREERFNSKIKLVVSSNPNAYAIERAERAGVDAVVCTDEQMIIEQLEKYEIELIVLAGYLKILQKDLLAKYSNRIINIHPSLLPKYGGKGMHGMHVHEAIFAAGEKISGATVHFVNEVVDGGKIILQEPIDISDCRSPKEIQEKVLTIEHQILPRAVKILEEV